LDSNRHDIHSLHNKTRLVACLEPIDLRLIPLRKLIAITLLAIFGLPFAASLFALTPQSDANLPACCRRGGKHHCMMSTAERRNLLGDEPGFTAPPEKCPYCPANVMGVHSPVHFKPSFGSVLRAAFVSQRAGVAQTKSKFLIAGDRAHAKRGPPLRGKL